MAKFSKGMNTVTGQLQLARNLAKLDKNIEAEVRKHILDTALKVQRAAIRSIQRGPKTGKTYRKPSGVTHRASAPGEAPASDIGELANNIQRVDDGLSAAVGTNVEHGKLLELGTRNIKPRPWLFPALEKNRRFFEQGTRRAMTKGTIKSTKKVVKK